MRLLDHFGVVSQPGPEDDFAATRLLLPLGAAASVMAPCSGLFEPFCDPGDIVDEGALAGRVWPIGELDQPVRELRFTQGGIVSVRRTGTLVERGDFVAQVAREISEAELLAG